MRAVWKLRVSDSDREGLQLTRGQCTDFAHYRLTHSWDCQSMTNVHLHMYLYSILQLITLHCTLH